MLLSVVSIVASAFPYQLIWPDMLVYIPVCVYLGRYVGVTVSVYTTVHASYITSGFYTLCVWCAYGSAPLAPINQAVYPPSIDEMEINGFNVHAIFAHDSFYMNNYKSNACVYICTCDLNCQHMTPIAFACY